MTDLADYWPTAEPFIETPRKCRHPKAAWRWESEPSGSARYCGSCGHRFDTTAIRRGRQSRNYGNRAELAAAKTYGGTKVGHAGGPVDIRGKDFDTQVKTHRRNPPAEWTKALAGIAPSGRVPRLLLRFLRPGNLGPDDWVVFRAKDFLDWFGKDE